MIKFLRKNNKKFLAIAGVFLMISFVATTRYNPAGGGGSAYPVGTIGKESLLNTDLEQARQDWHFLGQSVVAQTQGPDGQSSYVPFVTRLGSLQALGQDPKLFALLLKEADRMGVFVTDQQIDATHLGGIDVRLSDNRIVPADQIPETENPVEIRQAIGSFLRVSGAINRAADVVKISRPLGESKLAEELQSIQVRFASIDAAKLADKIPAPTTQQLSEQFEKYADKEFSGGGSASNAFGFGYKIPDKVRFESIGVPRRDLKDAIKKSKSDYEWDVAALVYYRTHKADFPATQPEGPPKDALVTVPATHPAPTTLPFKQVRDQIIDRIIAPDVDALAENVQNEILSTLSGDWAAYHAANPQATSAPSSAPAAVSTSSLGVPYDSYDYLKALAARIQKDFNVLPEVAAYNQPQSAIDLANLPGIGHAHAPGGAGEFATAAIDPALPLLQPSAALADDDLNTHIFRLTERLPAHRPADLSVVSAAVEADWKKGQAYDLAKSQAQALLDAARKLGLESAASTAGLSIATSAYFNASAGDFQSAMAPIANVPLTGFDVLVFKERAQKLLTPAAKHEPAVDLIEVPNESKALVIELAGIRPDWPDGQRSLAEAELALQLRRQLSQPIQQSWFTLPGVESRLGYVDKSKDSG